MRNKVIDLLDQTIEELDKEKIDGILEIPPKDDMGDFAFPCFQLAKVFRKAPNMIATELAEKIPASDDVSKVEAMGPYVNFFLNKENYVKKIEHTKKIINTPVFKDAIKKFHIKNNFSVRTLPVFFMKYKLVHIASIIYIVRAYQNYIYEKSRN